MISELEFGGTRMTARHSNPKVAYLLTKLDTLYTEIKSDEHYEATPSVAYGAHDPFDVPLVPCEVCFEAPLIAQSQDRPLRWLHQCSCGRRIKTSRKKPWQAALEWNWINLGSFDYQDMPLFGLGNLDATRAHQRLAGIRRNLELRKSIARIEGDVARLTERSIGIQQPGKGYTEKLEAYLMWCMWGLRLTKQAKLESKADL